MSIKFSEEIPSEFAKVRDAADNGHQALKDISAFFAAKAKIDDAHANAIKKLCANPPGTGMFTKEPPITKETKTLKDAVLAVLEQSVAIAEAELAMGKKVSEQVIKVLDDFAKDKENAKKKLQNDGNKLTQALQQKLSAAKKAEEQYTSACKAAKSAHEAAEKAEEAAGDDDKKKKSAERARSKADAAKAKAEQLQEAYEKAVEEGNATREEYLTEKMPETIDALQELHHERWEQVMSVIKFYASALSALPSAIEDAIGEIKDKVETQASLDEDIQEFVDALKGGESANDEFGALEFTVNEFFAEQAAAPAADGEEAKEDDE